MTKVEHELISDADICLLFEKGMRRGASYIYKRNDNANNQYSKSWDTKQNKNQNTLYTWTQIIYMVMLCLNLFQQTALNGKIQKSLIQVNIATICEISELNND